ncbi:hypothetical protein JTE90_029458 [Oedothorax gibbosus]|uniref:Uncharacterized protein n=1 Tax=Oedothorax gibbosus TaxID=931172 RepID=A0AAV6V533_9ARAC|nr:hypothetical protein JTE90_029458 [Oedothorax gibbosus]
MDDALNTRDWIVAFWSARPFPREIPATKSVDSFRADYTGVQEGFTAGESQHNGLFFLKMYPLTVCQCDNKVTVPRSYVDEPQNQSELDEK